MRFYCWLLYLRLLAVRPDRNAYRMFVTAFQFIRRAAESLLMAPTFALAGLILRRSGQSNASGKEAWGKPGHGMAQDAGKTVEPAGS